MKSSHSPAMTLRDHGGLPAGPDPQVLALKGRQDHPRSTAPRRVGADIGMDWEAFYNNFRKPDFISGYEIQNRLGGGAFGDVYKARKQSIGKAYAIKFLKIEDDTQRAAVEREMSQVRHFAAIDHPNLVSIEDLGTVMGVPFLIMGYAGEDTLARRLHEGALDVERALLYFTQACRGVLALHDRRLVHFDLKPSNVFLKGDVARVGDYGLSKLLTDGRMTLSYGRGTPQYMAPEMLRNRADHRADIYSLGVILFESLAGSLPFESDNPGGLVLREEDVPPPFPDGFPARIRPVVERCLRLSPDDRFPSVEELLLALDQTARPGDSVRLEPTVAAPEWSGPPAGDPAADSPTPSGEELRQRAERFTRGVVDVARGVRDGLRPEPGADPEREGLPPALPNSAADAEEESTTAKAIRRELEEARKQARREAPQGAGAGAGVAAFAGAGSSGVDPGREGSGAVDPFMPTRVLDEPVSAPTHGTAPLREPGRESSRGSAPAVAPVTIPVPPRVEGGVIGSILSTGVLGLEVLVALVGGVLRGMAFLVRSVGEWLSRSGNIAGQLLRAAAFFLFMAMVGAIVISAGLLVLGAVPL